MVSLEKAAISKKIEKFITPVMRATDETINNYGQLVGDHHSFDLPNLAGTELLTTSAIINFWWKGNSFYRENETTEDTTLLGWSVASDTPDDRPHSRNELLLQSADCYPTVGVFFHPLRGEDYIILLAPPSKAVHPEELISFYVNDGRGIYITPGVWHAGIIPLTERASFYYEQLAGADQINCNFLEKNKALPIVPIEKIKAEHT